MAEVNLSAFGSNVNSRAQKFSIKNSIKIILVMILALIVFVILAVIMSVSPLVTIGAITLILGVLYIRAWNYRKGINQIIKQVAQDNSWDLNKPLPADTAKSAAVFNLGTDGTVRAGGGSQLSGELSGLPFWLDYTDNGAFLLIDAKKDLPSAVFITSVLDTGPFKVAFDQAFKSQKMSVIKLEGDFDKYFRLYADPSKTVDVMSVVAPDFMASLIDNGLVPSVIFSDHYCLISASGITKDSLKALMQSGQALAKELNH